MMRVNEQSLCDPHRKTLTIQARNVRGLSVFKVCLISPIFFQQITLANLFTVRETLEYRVNPEDPTT